MMDGMPLIDLELPADAVPTDVEGLVDELTAALLRARGVPDTPASREQVWAYVRPARLFVGGAPAVEPRYVVRVAVVEGGVTERARAEMVEEMTASVVRHAGLGEDAADRVWVLLEEVPDGFWGAGGQVVRLADSQAILGAAGAAS
jgi:phenylpyruvate tautomerase PptA (4-oxalocrotonate tautomerase family)